MDTLAGEGVEEHRESSHEGLTLTGGHLGDVVGDLAIVGDAMEHHTTDELHVIVHHIPGDQVATCHPGVLVDSLIAIDGDKILTLTSQLTVSLGGSHFDGFILLETASRLLDHGKHFGESRVKIAGILGKHLLAEVVDFLPERLTLVIIERLDLSSKLIHLPLILGSIATDMIAHLVDASAELIVRDSQNLLRDGVVLRRFHRGRTERSD